MYQDAVFEEKLQKNDDENTNISETFMNESEINENVDEDLDKSIKNSSHDYKYLKPVRRNTMFKERITNSIVNYHNLNK